MALFAASVYIGAAQGAGRATVSPGITVLTAAALQRQIAHFDQPATVVHVWATWCAPCREEFPRLMRFQRDYADRGLRLILISADPPDKSGEVARYLQEQGAASPSYLIDNPNSDFINTLSTNWSGALPATFFFQGSGRLAQWWEGAATDEMYKQAAAKLLPPAEKRR
jgi:thiol-disulfide isomerase/thioredoxin